MPKTRKGAMSAGKSRTEARRKPVPKVGPLDALLRVTNTTIRGIDIHILRSGPERPETARWLGASRVVNAPRTVPVEATRRITGGCGVDAAIEAIGTPATFEHCLRTPRPGVTLSSRGLSLTDLRIPRDAFSAELGDEMLVTTLCSGGKERMRRVMEADATDGLDVEPRRCTLDRIEEACDLFGYQRDGVLKVANLP